MSKVVRPREFNKKGMLRLFPTYDMLLNILDILVAVIVDYWLLRLI